MGTMDGWSVVLLVVAAFVAVATLVKLMVRRREQRLGELRQRMAAGSGHPGEGGDSRE